nr:hypothetical protein Iba_chr04aCG13590 [Ipomoea batatas]
MKRSQLPYLDKLGNMIASSRGFNPNTPPSAVSLSDAYWKSLSTGHSWVLAFSQRKLEGGEISQLWGTPYLAKLNELDGLPS